MPRVSVVVPVYNVARYLEECLRSIAGQNVRDIEVVLVDDGSTDASPEIAARFAARDGRFRVVRQENAGLGAARNTGVREASGEFIAFADSDDVLPRDGYRALLAALDESGSDFASGGVRRIEHGRVRPAPDVQETFATTRLRTHIREFEPLLADRTAWNTLWRRSFWDEQQLSFPEGVWHEDIPVKLPAHLHARTVDVVADPVYHWRLRDRDRTSITQQRLTIKLLNERCDAIEHVYRLFLAEGEETLAEQYRARWLRDDLLLHLSVLHYADEEYRKVFMQRAGGLLAGTTERHYAGLPAAERREWELVRTGRTDELVALLRAERGRLSPRAQRLIRRIPAPIRGAVPRGLARRIVRAVGR